MTQRSTSASFVLEKIITWKRSSHLYVPLSTVAVTVCGCFAFDHLVQEFAQELAKQDTNQHYGSGQQDDTTIDTDLTHIMAVASKMTPL